VLNRYRAIKVCWRLENLDEHGPEIDLVAYSQSRITAKPTIDLRLRRRNTGQQQSRIGSRELGVLKTDSLVVAMNVLIGGAPKADNVCIDDSVTGDCNPRRPNLECTNQDTHRFTNRGIR
jgi:hypothetical protein